MATNLPEKCEGAAPTSAQEPVYKLLGKARPVEKLVHLRRFQRIAATLLFLGFFLFSAAFTRTSSNQPQENCSWAIAHHERWRQAAPKYEIRNPHFQERRQSEIIAQGL